MLSAEQDGGNPDPLAFRRAVAADVVWDDQLNAADDAGPNLDTLVMVWRGKKFAHRPSETDGIRDPATLGILRAEWDKHNQSSERNAIRKARKRSKDQRWESNNQKDRSTRRVQQRLDDAGQQQRQRGACSHRSMLLLLVAFWFHLMLPSHPCHHGTKDVRAVTAPRATARASWARTALHPHGKGILPARVLPKHPPEVSIVARNGLRPLRCSPVAAAEWAANVATRPAPHLPPRPHAAPPSPAPRFTRAHADATLRAILHRRCRYRASG